MARNGSGSYSNPYPNFVSGTVISSTQVDANNSDIATALTQSIAVDGQTTVTANLPMNAKKFTGLAVGSAATDSLNLGQAQAEAMHWCGTAGGSANAITLSPSPAITAYAAGQRFVWKASGSANTGATTVAISGLGTIALQDNGAALVAGNHAAGKVYMGILDTTSTMQVLQVQISGTDPLLVSSLTVSGTATVGGILSVDDTTTSTSGTTGSIHTDGGLGVAGTAFVAGAATVGGASQFNSTVTVGVDGTGYDVTFHGDTASRYVKWDESADSLLFSDNAKAVFGQPGNDLQIVHDTNNSFITDAGTGNLYLDSNAGNIYLRVNASENALEAVQNSGVTLYHNGNPKIATVAGGVTVTGGIAGVTSINAGALGGRRNIVFNGNGAVNQRFGTTANTTINTYGPDRWRSYGGALGFSWTSVYEAAVDGDGYYMRFHRTASDSQTNNTGIVQGLETKDSRYLAGQEITLSFRARAGANWSPASGRLTASVVGGEGTDQNPAGMTNSDTIIAVNADMSAGSDWATFSGSGTVPSDKTQLSFRFAMTPVGTAGANDYFDVRNIQVEVGGTATTFEQTQIGEESARCQRYYEKSYNATVVPGTSTNTGKLNYVIGAAANITWRLGVTFRTSKRASPTFTVRSSTGAAGNVRLNNGSDLSVTTESPGDNAASFYFTRSAAGGDFFWFHYEADAEL